MSRYIFDNINNKNIHHVNNYDSDNNNDINFINNKTFTFDKDCLIALKNNHRPFYHETAKRCIENITIFDIEPYYKDYIIIDNALINTEGAILTSNNELYYNGGCLCRGTNTIFDKKFHEDIIISITALWAGNIWHFPYEAFVALMSIPQNILYETKIHVSKINKYVIQWFKFLNIPETQLITGCVYANKIYLPRMGKCGNPYYSQIKWIKSIVNKNIHDTPFEYLIVIKRNSSRALRNYNVLEEVLDKFCKKINLKLYIHDDNNLPSLIDQQNAFNKAKIVFAPHGAGGIHIISMKSTSWYIEFLSVEDINICFSKLAYFCNINYKGISMKNSTVDIEKLHVLLSDLLPQIQ